MANTSSSLNLALPAPVADNVAINPVPGLTATNTQDALAELQTNISAVASGIHWKSPIEDSMLLSDILSTPPVSPNSGDSYLVGPSGTGAWSGKAGHIMSWNGSSWIDVLGVAVSIGTRLGIAFESGTASGNFTGQESKIFVITNATPGSYAYSTETNDQYDTVTVIGVFSPHFGDIYNFDGSIWVEIASGTRTASSIVFEPDGDITATNVQAAVVEVRDDAASATALKADKVITINPGTGLTGGGDLSADRTLTLADTAVAPATYGDATHVGQFTVDAQGRLTAAASVAISVTAPTGTLKGVRVLTSGTSYTPTSGTAQIVATLVGGGAGGGGNGTTGVIVAASGGGAGATCISPLVAVGAGPYTYAIGAAGAGGVGNANGSTGGSTSLTISGTYTAGGGTGGLAAGTSANARKAGSAGGTATGGDINIDGGRGSSNFHTNGTTPNSGFGGQSMYGHGGTGQYADAATSAVGFSGTGYGAGGGGSVNSATTTARNGGAGTQGIIIIYEYS